MPGLQTAAAAFGSQRLLFVIDFPFQPRAVLHTTVNNCRRFGQPAHIIMGTLDRNAALLFSLNSH